MAAAGSPPPERTPPTPPPTPPSPPARVVLGVKDDGGCSVEGHTDWKKYIITVFIVKTVGDVKEGLKNVSATWVCAGRIGKVTTPSSEFETATTEYVVKGYGKKVTFHVSISNGEDYYLTLYGPNEPHDREPKPSDNSSWWTVFKSAVKGAFHG